MIDSDRYLIVSKVENINVADVAASIELMTGDKPHIDSGKEEILTAVARQIISHREEGLEGTEGNREVHRWAYVLYHYFFVENRRNKSREVGLKSLETELFNLIAKLQHKDDD